MKRNGLTKQQHSKLAKTFDEAFDEQGVLIRGLRSENPGLFEGVVKQQLVDEGFPDEATIDNTEVMIQVFTKVDYEVWADKYIEAHQLNNADSEMIDSLIADKEKATDFIIDNMELANLTIMVAESVYEWQQANEAEYEGKYIEKEILREALQSVNRRKLRILIRRRKIHDINKLLEDELRRLEVDPNDINFDELEYILIDNQFNVSLEELVDICYKEVILEDKPLDYYINNDMYDTILDYVEYIVNIAVAESNIISPKAIEACIEDVLPDVITEIREFILETDQHDMIEMVQDALRHIGVVLDRYTVSGFREGQEYALNVIYNSIQPLVNYVYDKLQSKKQTVESYIYESDDFIDDAVGLEIAEPEVELLLDGNEYEEYAY